MLECAEVWFKCVVVVQLFGQFVCFFFNDTATTEIYTYGHTLSRHDALPISLTTTGDRVQDRALAEIGGKALWTKELDAALLGGHIDAAVQDRKSTRLNSSH